MSKKEAIPYTPDEWEIIERFKVLIKEMGTAVDAGKLFGISGSIVSSMLANKYTGRASEKLSEIKAYLDLKDETAQKRVEMIADNYVKPDYVPTSTSTQVYNLIRECHLEGMLAIACGDAGVGKTMAVRQYCKDHPHDTIRLTLNPCLTSQKSLLKLLAMELGVVAISLDDLWLGIAGKLRDGMIIIIDEAQHLPYKTIESIRSFPDYFYDRGETLGMIFVGHPDTAQKLSADHNRKFAQVHNRMLDTVTCRTTEIQRHDIEMLFPLLVDRKMEKEIDFLLKISQTIQGIRGAENLFKKAYKQKDYSFDGLVAAAKARQMKL